MRRAPAGSELTTAADLAHATRVDYETWRRRGARARVFEVRVSPVCDML